MKRLLKTTLTVLVLAVAPLTVISCAGTGSVASPTTTPGTKSYPLKTCIVTDNDLGSMGDEQRIVHNGQEIKFCCKPCLDQFRKNPEKYLAKLR